MGEEEAFLLSTIHLLTIDLVMESGSVAPEKMEKENGMCIRGRVSFSYKAEPT